MTYKVFISYSHAADDKLAPALQSALHRFAKPFYRLRALRVFRDKTSLHLTPELWPLIQQALAQSEYLLLLASPGAARSQWVQAEVNEWLKLRDGAAEKILLVLTDGEIVWDDAAGDFDWGRTDALPPSLRGVFRREPLYSDLRWARTATDLSLRNPQFLDEVGSLGATLHGKSKDEMIGNDVRQHRLFKAVTAAAVVLLLALTTAATGTAVYAVRQRDEAQRQTAEAQNQRAEAERQRKSAVEAAERERQAADRERLARENEKAEREKAEQATENEKAAKNQAEERRREAERQRRIADERRAEAERERNVANSRELAATADSQLDSDPELSVMLSLKAHERTPTAEAEAALRRSLLRSRVRATFRTLNWFNVTYSPDGKWFVLMTSVARVVEPGTWRVLAELRGPERWNIVRSVGISRDARRLLTLSESVDDKRTTLRLWEVGTWRLLSEVSFPDKDLYRAALSPDGRLAATWSHLKKRPRVWNLDTGESVPLGEGEMSVEGMTFSPDGKTLAVAASDGGGEAPKTMALEAATGRLLTEFDCRGVRGKGVAYSPDGKYLALLCWKGAPRVFEAATGRVAAELDEQGAHLTAAAFSPDGKYLVTAGWNRTASVWEAETWRRAAVLRGHTGTVEGVAFSGDAGVLVTWGEDGTARAWEAGTWRGLAVFQGGHTLAMYDLAVSPDARYVVTSAKDSLARVWELGANDSEVTEIDGSSRNGAAEELPTVFSPDGRFVATRNANRAVEVREPSTGRKAAELIQGNFLSFSPDGKYAFTTGGGKGVVLVWDVGTWRKVAELPGQIERIMGVAFSPDGRYFAAAGETVEVWDLSTRRSVVVQEERSWRAAFSPDGRWLVTFGADNTVRVREAGTWREAAVLSGHTAWVRAMAFSGDGSRLITSGEDQTARVWEAGTWRCLAVLKGHTDRVDEAALSPDGRYAVTGSWDNTARLWEAGTGRLVAVLAGHESFINSVRFSPDGRLVATAADTTVRVWDGTTGRPVTVLAVFAPGRDSTGSERRVAGASFSPDGKSLLASGSDDTTRIYSWETFAPVEDLLALGRARVTRELTAEEKKRYLHETADAGKVAVRP